MDVAPHYDQRPACAGRTDVFFPAHINIKTLNAARDICRECPIYEACVAYWLPRYDEQPHGIMFGYSERQRRLIDGGYLEYRDWRQEGRLITKTQLWALEHKALEEGVREVVDVYRIYEVEDQNKRLQIMRAYHRWCSEQRFQTTMSAIQRRCDRLTKIAKGATDRGGRRLAVPADLRPACPNGHRQKDMTRQDSRHPNRWTCYICRAKVDALAEDLVADELQRSA